MAQLDADGRGGAAFSVLRMELWQRPRQPFPVLVQLAGREQRWSIIARPGFEVGRLCVWADGIADDRCTDTITEHATDNNTELYCERRE